MWGDAAAPVERPSSERLPGHDSIGDQGVTVQYGVLSGAMPRFLAIGPSWHGGRRVGDELGCGMGRLSWTGNQTTSESAGEAKSWSESRRRNGDCRRPGDGATGAGW